MNRLKTLALLGLLTVFVATGWAVVGLAGRSAGSWDFCCFEFRGPLVRGPVRSADARGEKIPLPLPSALHHIEVLSQREPIVSGSPATAHLWIVNPSSDAGLARLFSTHPPTASRVELLVATAVRGSPAACETSTDQRERI
jgi:hypothetical protein